jgi:hypothetical protein
VRGHLFEDPVDVVCDVDGAGPHVFEAP